LKGRWSHSIQMKRRNPPTVWMQWYGGLRNCSRSRLKRVGGLLAENNYIYVMDLITALFSPQSLRKKELGLPRQMPWHHGNEMWIPYSNNDNTYIERAYKAMIIIQAIVSKIIDKASDAPGQVMRIKNDRSRKGYFAQMYYAQLKGARTAEAIFKAKALKAKA